MSSIVLKDLSFLEGASSEQRDLKGGMKIPNLPGFVPLLLPGLDLNNMTSIPSHGSSNGGKNSSSATAQISGDEGGTIETFTLTSSQNS